MLDFKRCASSSPLNKSRCIMILPAAVDVRDERAVGQANVTFIGESCV